MYKFWMLCLTGVVVGLSGCAKISSRVVEKPRVDQKLEGNRGYIGSGARMPEEPPRKSTRKLFYVDVEMATMKEMNPWPADKDQKQAAQGTEAPVAAAGVVDTKPRISASDIRPVPPPPASRPVKAEPLAETTTTYKVGHGDTLEKIAGKVYGDASKWRVIYDANRDVLNSPNRIYPGMELLIPALPEQAKRESGTFK